MSSFVISFLKYTLFVSAEEGENVRDVNVFYYGTLRKICPGSAGGMGEVLLQLVLHRQEAWTQSVHFRGCYKGLQKHKNENHRVVWEGKPLK